MDWDSLAAAIGGGKKKEGGKVEGGRPGTFGHIHPALPSHRGAATVQGPRPTSLRSGLAPGEISGHELHVTGGKQAQCRLVLQAAQLVSGKAKFGIHVP